MGIWSALASAYGTKQSNINIDKQIAAQSKENAVIRNYNLRLAKLQNQWNLQQWNLENAYNSPAAQMERMRQAGLNPDMMYGGGLSGNMSASSPDLTSGAAASPMDFSALGNKKTILDTAMQKAQLDNMNAQTEKLKSETDGQNIDNEWKPIEKAFGVELTNSQIALNRKELQHIGAKITNLQASTANLDSQTVLNKLDAVFQTETMQDRIKQVAEAARKAGYDADKAKADAQVALKTIMSRVAMAQNQADKAKHEAGTALEEKFIKQFEANSQGFRLFLDCIDKGIDIFEAFLDFKDFQNKKKSVSGQLLD